MDSKEDGVENPVAMVTEEMGEPLAEMPISDHQEAAEVMMDEEEEIGEIYSVCHEAEAALENDLIVETILECLHTAEDLKKFRLLSQNAYHQGTKKMSQIAEPNTGTLVNAYKDYRTKNKARENDLGKWDTQKLVMSEMFEVMSKAEIRPFEAVRVNSWIWNLSSPTVLEFFTTFGPGIKELSFGKGGNMTVSQFEKLLLLTPNVEIIVIHPKFKLNGSPGRDRIAPLSLYGLKKESLKKLRVIRLEEMFCPPSVSSRPQTDSTSQWPSIVKELVRAAGTSLEAIQGIPATQPHCIEALIQDSKTLSVIKDYTALLLSHRAFVESFITRDLHRQQLQSLVIETGYPTIEITEPLWTEFLNEMLLASKDSLEHFGLLRKKEVHLSLSLPVLSKVKFLDLFDLYRFGTKWMTGTSTARTFPNLEEVEANKMCCNYTSRFREKNLPEDNEFRAAPVPSVRSLILKQGKFDDFSIDFLARKFPNVTRVQAQYKGMFRTHPHILWLLPETVETLEVVNVDLSSFANYRLDEWLTGIPHNVCSMMRHLKKDSMDFGKLRTELTILRLKNLKRLRLVCKEYKPRPKERQDWQEQPNVLPAIQSPYYASNVSKWLVFEKMPDLGVSILFPAHYQATFMDQEKKGLELISDLVTLFFKRHD